MLFCSPQRVLICLMIAAWTLSPKTCDVLRADDVIGPDPAPRWWKGNLHTHTFWSDGDDFPEMVCEWYREHGYQFLALPITMSSPRACAGSPRRKSRRKVETRSSTTICARFGPNWVEMRGPDDRREVRLKPLDEFRALVEERGRFLLIAAEEISTTAERVPVHINASNIHEAISPLGGETVRETIANNLRGRGSSDSGRTRDPGSSEPSEFWLRDHCRGYRPRGHGAAFRGV